MKKKEFLRDSFWDLFFIRILIYKYNFCNIYALCVTYYVDTTWLNSHNHFYSPNYFVLVCFFYPINRLHSHQTSTDTFQFGPLKRTTAVNHIKLLFSTQSVYRNKWTHFDVWLMNILNKCCNSRLITLLGEQSSSRHQSEFITVS